MTSIGMADDVARVVIRTDEVMGAGKHVWTLQRDASAAGTLIGSLDDLAHASVPSARTGQPIGVMRHGEGFELVPLDARRKAAAMVSPHNYPSVGGLTMRVESVHALDDGLVGMTALRTNGTIGKFYEAGHVPRSAVFG